MRFAVITYILKKHGWQRPCPIRENICYVNKGYR